MEYSDQGKDFIRNYALSSKPGRHRTTCPECSHTRKNKQAQCVVVTIHEDRAVYKCWHCEAAGAVSLRDHPRQAPRKPVQSVSKPKPTALKEVSKTLSEHALEWLVERGISKDTADHFGLRSARAYFMNIKAEEEGIALPYHTPDKLGAVGHKVRALSSKDHICKPALYSLFGLQHVDVDEKSQMIITEGEFDALAMYEAGALNPVSVPNGASSFTKSDDADEKATYGFLWSAKEIIDKTKKVIIACDNDEPGEKLAEELARRIGRHRCWRVRYPDDCKDANDVLVKHGKEALKECVDKAESWPVEGLYEVEAFKDDVIDLYENGFGERIRTGLAAVDDVYSVGKGLLTVVTGIPNHGKSSFIDQLMMNASLDYGYTHAICSFENPVPVHIGKLCQVYSAKHFFETDIHGERMTRDEVTEAMQFVHEHFKFLQQEDGNKATLDSIIERIETAVFRWGVNTAVIDPYNYIAKPKSIDSETQWIDEMLTRLRLLAKHYGLHIWFIAHPTKQIKDSNGNYQCPKGYDISGSAAWFSKPDFGMSVHRTFNGGEVMINVWKVRFDWMGQVGEAAIYYNNVQHQYMSGDTLPAKPPEDVKVRYSVYDQETQDPPF